MEADGDNETDQWIFCGGEIITRVRWLKAPTGTFYGLWEVRWQEAVDSEKDLAEAIPEETLDVTAAQVDETSRDKLLLDDVADAITSPPQIIDKEKNINIFNRRLHSSWTLFFKATSL